jgi:hypothetical protein
LLKRFWIILLLVSATTAQAASAGHPSRLKVLGLSLLVPGLGHRALGNSTRGQIFTAADAGLWTAYGTFRFQGHLRKNSYIEMAQVLAGVRNPDNHPDSYYRRLGQYPSSDYYNEEVRAEARARFEYDLDARAAWYDGHKVPADEEWHWTSESDWMRYRDKRSDSQLANRHGRYMIGLAVANRLIAAFDAMRLMRGHHRGSAMSFYLSGDPAEPREPVRLCVGMRLP